MYTKIAAKPEILYSMQSVELQYAKKEIKCILQLRFSTIAVIDICMYQKIFLSNKNIIKV